MVIYRQQLWLENTTTFTLHSVQCRTGWEWQCSGKPSRKGGVQPNWIRKMEFFMKASNNSIIRLSQNYMHYTNASACQWQSSRCLVLPPQRRSEATMRDECAVVIIVRKLVDEYCQGVMGPLPATTLRRPVEVAVVN